MDGLKRFPAASRLGDDRKAEEAGKKKEEFGLGFHVIEIERWTTARAFLTVKLFDIRTPNWRENLQICMGFVQLTWGIRPMNLPSVRPLFCQSFANKLRQIFPLSATFEQPNINAEYMRRTA